MIDKFIFITEKLTTQNLYTFSTSMSECLFELDNEQDAMHKLLLIKQVA